MTFPRLIYLGTRRDLRRALRNHHETGISKGSVTHLELTSRNKRHSEMISAQIAEIETLSPTIKGFSLKVSQNADPATFYPGQWIDLYLPEIDQVGGYSICSSPSELKKFGTIDLAIKASDWAPARWMHKEAKIGDAVKFRIGGDFHYPNSRIRTMESHDLVLIAGGVGINPLMAICTHAIEQPPSGLDKITLLYSSKTRDELIFKCKLDNFVTTNKNFSVKYFATNTEPRLGNKDLALLSNKNSLVFICGPTIMIREVEQLLLESGLGKEQIFYELWT